MDSPAAAIRVPEGMTTERFLFRVGNEFPEFVKAVQEGCKAAREGDLDAVDSHLETIARLGGEWKLRGYELHNQYLMAHAISHHRQLPPHPPQPDPEKIKKYAEKYELPVEQASR